MLQTLNTCLILINALAAALMLADKHMAKARIWRIPEAMLIGLAIFGGSPGILLGMYLVRHKTRHPKFSIGVPLILTVQLGLIWFLTIKT